MSEINILSGVPGIDDFVLNTTAPGIVAGLFSCAFAFVQYKIMMGKKIGEQIGKPKLDKLAKQIKSGSIAFLKQEYTYLAAFVCFLAALLFGLFTMQNDPLDGVRVVIAFTI